ncbi:hypothetical protein BJ742DRAFT_740736 [Cladochytrium replicatum]|nr:hypothetical protein BJ742DRAFT_740736 [Cladochytrium replicatum]
MIRNITSQRFGAFLALYMLLVRLLRYRNLAKTRRLAASARKLKESPAYFPRNYGEPLDQYTYQLYMLLMEHEFPRLILISTEFALFKTYSIPTISKLLRATGEFRRNPLKRVEDTTLLMEEHILFPEVKERGPVAIKRINEIHGRYRISNDDFLYTLAQHVLEPIRWVKEFGYRKMEKHEEDAIFMLYKVVGEKMNIEDIPDTLEELEKWTMDYEKKHQVYADSNREIGDITLSVGTELAPTFLRPALLTIAYSLIPQEVRVALDYPEAPAWVQLVVRSLLKGSGWFIRFLMLPRFFPLNRLRNRMDRQGRIRPKFAQFKNIYEKDGYRIEELGPGSKFAHNFEE